MGPLRWHGVPPSPDTGAGLPRWPGDSVTLRRPPRLLPGRPLPAAGCSHRASPPCPASCAAARFLPAPETPPAPFPRLRRGTPPRSLAFSSRGHGGLCHPPLPPPRHRPPSPCPRPARSTSSTTAPFPLCVPSTQPFLTQLEVYCCYLSNSLFYLSVLECKTFMVQIFKDCIVFASSDTLYFSL